MLHKIGDLLRRGFFGSGLNSDANSLNRLIQMIPTLRGGGQNPTNHAIAVGDTLPTSAAGYAIGCIFVLINAAANTQVLYGNTGTATSATWTKITDIDALNPTGSLTILTGKTLTVTDLDALLVGGIKVPTAESFAFPLNVTSLAVATDVWTADRAWQVTQIQETHSVVSSGGANVKIRKITDTSAPGAAASGTVKELIDATNSTASALDLTSTINTKKAAAARVLSLTAADLQFAVGDRMAFFPASAPTGYVGQITVTMKAI